MQYGEMLTYEFDQTRRILHVHFLHKVHLKTMAEADVHFREFENAIKDLAGGEKVYLIIDLSNLIIEPSLAEQYARQAKRISSQYAYPNGIARYGHQITRITIIQGYRNHLQCDPNLFSSGGEAQHYIENLISSSSESSPVSQTKL